MKNRLIVLAGCLLLLAAAPLLADEAEDKAVKAVEKLGGRFTRDEKAEGRPVVAVDLINKKVTDADLKELAGLKGLKDLDLLGCKEVTDAGLKEVAKLKGLERLVLGGKGVTDAGLKELAGLKTLRMLALSDTQVTDDGVAELQKALPDCKIAY